MEKYHLFIGRWQPFHKGHKTIIDTFVNNGKKVLIAIMDTEKDERNPYTVEERKEMITKVYKDNDLVSVISILPIESVCIGREVGYSIMEVPEEIKFISATKIRKGEIQNDLEEYIP